MPDEPVAVVPEPALDANRNPFIDRWWADFDRNVRAVREDIEDVREVRPRGGVPIRFVAALDPFGRTLSTEGKRGEELFQLILSGIREIFDVDAVIAGGCVRDLAAGTDYYKDVDVFVPLTWKKFQQGVEELGWQGPTARVGKPKGAKNYDGKMDCVVESVDRASSRVQNVNVDLVFTKKPLDLAGVATFPVFAQRCVWTLEGGKALSPEARKDIENKTFTIDPTITDKDRIKNILEKVNEWKKRDHYKDWKVVEPDVKEWWEAKEEMAKTPLKKDPLVYGTKEWAHAYIAGQVDAAGRWRE